MCAKPITGVKHQVSRRTQSRHTANIFPLHLLNLFSFYLSFSLCSNESPPLFANDVLQHWTMVKLVLLQIVADVFVDVGHILGATADTMLDTE